MSVEAGGNCSGDVRPFRNASKPLPSLASPPASFWLVSKAVLACLTIAGVSSTGTGVGMGAAMVFVAMIALDILSRIDFECSRQ